MEKKSGEKIIAENRKARHDYFVIEAYEAGIELFGTEVKSLRAGGVNLKDSYCDIDNGELFALGVHISPYEQGKENIGDHAEYSAEYKSYLFALQKSLYS